MRLPLRVALLAMVLVATAAWIEPAAARPRRAAPAACQQGMFASGALWEICVPAQAWNGGLVVYAHGFVKPGAPLAIDTKLLDGTDLATLVPGLGYAFATTSYRRNGLAIVEGADDIRELVAAAPGVLGSAPARTYLVGASEGGLIATLLAEQSPQLFGGALTTCAPIGDFQRQINYVGDFRALFDYFFPGVIPPSPISIPQAVIDSWAAPAPGGGAFKAGVAVSSPANQAQTQQLLSTAAASIQAPIDASNLLTGTLGVLWYNIYATNDAAAQLGGSPYDNHDRLFLGSSDDTKLNGSTGVQRFTADSAAKNNIATKYETSGDVSIPLVTLHTTVDEIVPIWHEQLYLAKARAHGRSITQITVSREGHCNFTSAEILSAFNMVVLNNRAYLPAIRR